MLVWQEQGRGRLRPQSMAAGQGQVIEPDADNHGGAHTHTLRNTSGYRWGPAMADSWGLERRHWAWGLRELEGLRPRLCPRLEGRREMTSTTETSGDGPEKVPGLIGP